MANLGQLICGYRRVWLFDSAQVWAPHRGLRLAHLIHDWFRQWFPGMLPAYSPEDSLWFPCCSQSATGRFAMSFTFKCSLGIKMVR